MPGSCIVTRDGLAVSAILGLAVFVLLLVLGSSVVRYVYHRLERRRRLLRRLAPPHYLGGPL